MIAELRDEIARLKGSKGRPSIKPSGYGERHLAETKRETRPSPGPRQGDTTGQR